MVKRKKTKKKTKKIKNTRTIRRKESASYNKIAKELVLLRIGFNNCHIQILEQLDMMAKNLDFAVKENDRLSKHIFMLQQQLDFAYKTNIELKKDCGQVDRVETSRC